MPLVDCGKAGAISFSTAFEESNLSLAHKTGLEEGGMISPKAKKVFTEQTKFSTIHTVLPGKVLVTRRRSVNDCLNDESRLGAGFWNEV